MRVLVLDPGERVGWASAVVDYRGKDGVAQPKATLTTTGHGIAYLKDAAMTTYRAVAIEKRYDHVVWERWRLTAKGARVSVGSDMESSQFIGMVRLSCWLGGVPFTVQGTDALSSAVKSLKCGHPSAADVADRIAKLPESHDESHDRSALLHLWTWFFNAYV